eukprot:CAMPEP_0185026680 /NCGR_PEP_ID=MMETSP1103-20130426/11005_1 /TAXON_ID=36769 /ORGANISM="Paraphysomonas bandaiensis, Strain Caron Lab Isolate" /LENGTH=425 /DNA_ID=CAMNT_0027560345 /DNA_START=56 /DNA_END=1330 /DNA_ORIENTATION=-
MEVEDRASTLHFDHLNKIMSRPSPFGNETGKLPNGYYEPSSQLHTSLREKKILVIGAGGLGCEILKNLALSGLTNITVIDLDTIDISNLNRQFLFRMDDVGKSKALVAADFIMSRVPGCSVTARHGKIQDFGEDFYSEFNVVVSGLDNIEARRWLNNVLVGLVQYDEDGDIVPESIVPLIDGGTEGLKGQARVIIPKVTSCFECSMELFPPQRHFPLCTIRETPRLPEHCITYAFAIEWERTFPDRKLDTDSPNDMQWVYHVALRRAQQYGIEGVTYFLTLGVVKNVIPAVASTNAVIAAACVNEALKLLSFASQSLNNYLMYMGGQGLYTSSFEYQQNKDCIVCADPPFRTLHLPSDSTLEALLQTLAEDPGYQMKAPFISSDSLTLYAPNPPSLREQTQCNLPKTLHDLIVNGEVLRIRDTAL